MEAEPVQQTTFGAPLRSFSAFLTFLPPVASARLSRADGFVSTGQRTALPYLQAFRYHKRRPPGGIDETQLLFWVHQ